LYGLVYAKFLLGFCEPYIFAFAGIGLPYLLHHWNHRQLSYVGFALGRLDQPLKLRVVFLHFLFFVGQIRVLKRHDFFPSHFSYFRLLHRLLLFSSIYSHMVSVWMLHPIMKRKQAEVKKHLMKAALKKGVDDGILVQVKSSYKLSTASKEAASSKRKVSTAPEGAVLKKKVRFLLLGSCCSDSYLASCF
jgi:hypothetical protein